MPNYLLLVGIEGVVCGLSLLILVNFEIGIKIIEAIRSVILEGVLSCILNINFVGTWNVSLHFEIHLAKSLIYRTWTILIGIIVINLIFVILGIDL